MAVKLASVWRRAQPSSTVVFAMVMVFYFLVCSGAIYGMLPLVIVSQHAEMEMQCPNHHSTLPPRPQRPRESTRHSQLAHSVCTLREHRMNIVFRPPSSGQVIGSDGRLHSVPVMKGKVNSQYITEGLSAGLMFVLGAGGYILLDVVNGKRLSVFSRNMWLGLAVAMIVGSYAGARVFLSIKIPKYLSM
eukprot:m.300933 g.300933  ORF g.300933 m.300933 type:complete len:189 (-) comp19562_c0_seq1:103-669(-)